MKSINTQEFKELVYDFQKNPNNFIFNGKKPLLLDFYADWCAPCKSLMPIIDSLSIINQDVDFFKLNVEDESDVTAFFNIRNIPYLLLINKEGEKKTISGYKSKDELQNIINNFLKK
jgi:thioredoxin